MRDSPACAAGALVTGNDRFSPIVRALFKAILSSGLISYEGAAAVNAGIPSGLDTYASTPPNMPPFGFEYTSCL